MKGLGTSSSSSRVAERFASDADANGGDGHNGVDRRPRSRKRRSNNAAVAIAAIARGIANPARRLPAHTGSRLVSVDFLHYRAAARIDQQNAIVGIDIAVLRE
jgi:hypothetical protein